MKYEKYLAKVNILNQKKDFLKKFRDHLPVKQKLILVSQIKQDTSEVHHLEANLFKC